MSKKQLLIKIKEKIKSFINKFLLLVGFIAKYNPITKQRLKAFFSYLRRSWKSIAVILPLFLLSYYTIGGYVTNTINKNTSVEIMPQESGLNTVASMSYLIKREVDENMWTPNLPFIFPGYVLDNMPAFQTGVLDAVKSSVKVLYDVYASEDLKKAYDLLKYPPNIWILSKGENLALAPSSGAQYRKARKELLKFNKEFEFPANKDEKVLHDLLAATEKKLNKISNSLEKQVREVSSNWIDLKADDVFYFNQGRIYGYYVILKSVSVDFKTQIMKYKQYDKLTSVFKELDDALAIEPMIVRNGEINSIGSANHLMALNYYITKACYYLSQIKNDIVRDVK